MTMEYLIRRFQNFKKNPYKMVKNSLKDNFKNHYYKKYNKEKKRRHT